MRPWRADIARGTLGCSRTDPRMPKASLEIHVHDAIARIPQEQWDALDGVAEVPFLSWTFLHALEKTGCVGGDSGWIPHHLTLHEPDASGASRLVAAAPAYVKLNSEGEFVFDHGWASAAHRAKIRYYPKLVVAVPFTPATAHRLLVAVPSERPRLLVAFASALEHVVAKQRLSSAHVLFPTEDEARVLAGAGMAHRYGVQYQWHRRDRTTWDDFLASFSSKRRHQIRRERRLVAEQGLAVSTLTGPEIAPALVDAAYRFYLSTVDKFAWGRRYLNRAFFEEIFVEQPGVELVVARRGRGLPIAGAVNFAGRSALFGRYWGATEEIPMLHFEVCYYHSIERCLARGLSRFEPGAGGSHKRARGFDPTLTHSVHMLADGRLDAAVRDYLEHERVAVEAALRGEGDDDD